MTGLVWGLGLLALVCSATAVALTLVGERRWATAMQALQVRLDASRSGAEPGGSPWPTHYDERELEGLPAPVQRYFRAVLKDGQPTIGAATIELAGTFNMSPTAEQWKPFTSRQRIITRRPGFLWDAKIAMLPGVNVRVVDSYIAGQGLLRATIQGLFTMAEMHGDGEIARGELMRWFAEVPWVPTALLPSQGVRWQAIDDRSANASVLDGPLGMSLLFRFDDAGLISAFRAEARGGLVDGKMVMAPWEGRWSNYQSHGGIMVPFTGEVAWMRPEGRKPYFVGTVSSLSFEFRS